MRIVRLVLLDFLTFVFVFMQSCCEGTATTQRLQLTSADELGGISYSVACNDAYLYYVDGMHTLVRLDRESGAELARLPVFRPRNGVAWGDYVITTGEANAQLDPASDCDGVYYLLWPADFTAESEPLQQFCVLEGLPDGSFPYGSELFGPDNTGGNFLKICRAGIPLERQLPEHDLSDMGEVALFHYGEVEIPVVPYRDNPDTLRRLHYEEGTGILYLMFVDEPKCSYKVSSSLPPTEEETASRKFYDSTQAKGCMVTRIDLAEKRIAGSLELPYTGEAVFYADEMGAYSLRARDGRVRRTLWDGTSALIGKRIPRKGTWETLFHTEPARLYVEVAGGYAFFFSTEPLGWRQEADGTRWKDNGMLAGIVKLAGE